MSTNPSIHFTLVGSNIHDSFLESLKSKPEKYAYTAVSSFADYKPPADTEVHVVVLHGYDDELAKTTTVAQLLDQPIVLAFFAPSKDVLNALQDASKSLVHIPSIELDDGAPIIIRRRPDDGVISLMPGFTDATESIPGTNDTMPDPFIPNPASSIPTSPPTPEEKLAMNYEKSVNLIQLTVEHHLELLHRDEAKALRDGDHMKPPKYLKYYRAIDLVPVPFDSTPSTFDNQRFKCVYRVRVHAYYENTNGKPTDGGEVHVVAVLGGEVFRDANYRPRLYDPQQRMVWFLDASSFRVHPRPGESELIPVKSEPQYSQTNGLDTTYKIEFSRTFMLYGTLKPEPFDASYGEAFTRNQFKQKAQSLEGGFDVLTYYDNYYDKSLGDVPYEGAKGWKNSYDNRGHIKSFPEDYFPLHALFHWRTSKLRFHTIDIFSGLTYVHFISRSTKPFRYQSSSGNGRSHVLDLSVNSWN